MFTICIVLMVSWVPLTPLCKKDEEAVTFKAWSAWCREVTDTSVVASEATSEQYHGKWNA